MTRQKARVLNPIFFCTAMSGGRPSAGVWCCFDRVMVNGGAKGSPKATCKGCAHQLWAVAQRMHASKCKAAQRPRAVRWLSNIFSSGCANSICSTIRRGASLTSCKEVETDHTSCYADQEKWSCWHQSTANQVDLVDGICGKVEDFVAVNSSEVIVGEMKEWIWHKAGLANLLKQS